MKKIKISFRFLFVLTVLLLASCDSSKKKSKNNLDNSINANDNKIKKQRNLSKLKVYHNIMVWPKNHFKIRVLYYFDPKNLTYKEWVQYERKELKWGSHLELDLTEEVQNVYGQKTENFLEDVEFNNSKVDYVSEKNLKILETRFAPSKEEIDLENLIEKFQNDPQYELAFNEYDQCLRLLQHYKRALVLQAQGELQKCKSSKYYDMAINEARGFFAKDFALFYKNFFGLNNLNKSLTTVFLNDEDLGLSTVVSQTKNSIYQDISIAHKTLLNNLSCDVGIVYNRDFGFTQKHIGSADGLLFESPRYINFVKVCDEIYRKNESFNKTVLNKKFHDVSSYFIDEIVKYSYSPFNIYIFIVDDKMSEIIDNYIDRYDQQLVNATFSENLKSTYELWQTRIQKQDDSPIELLSSYKETQSEMLDFLNNILNFREAVYSEFPMMDRTKVDDFYYYDEKAVDEIKESFVEVDL